MRDRYRTPAALDAAISAKAKQVAAAAGTSPGDLVTAFHLQRLMARVFFQGEGWMLKGGQSLLVRFPHAARLSRDVDLFRPDTDDLEQAVEEFGLAVSREIDDYFRFTRESVAIHDGTAKVKVGVRIGVQRKQPLDVDLIVRRTPIGEPTRAVLTPTIPVDWPDTWPSVVLYPLVDHLGDKLAAIWERHRRYGRESVASTRFRDLADALLMAQQAQFDGVEVRKALASEVVRRNALGGVELTLPAAFEVPDQVVWAREYPKAAAQVTGLIGCRNLAEAEAAAHRFVDPLLAEQDPGIWDPAAAEWRPRRP
ncbi:nucleotidyl transferase AbiEii/AbiGii toxin family protein [Actinospica sp. MGRD01-02]|uniref:Nucleotidyl transferase AbiEii/AbiGii toxin family protein n=1 Tax=Actinospica acidithermotolerans TaxID=2828514 RepID=A0A941IPP8_9ACTN|nr:nucleotidyl transferase AbiEii/AbiGii toxin family protein [Actinospica acidithermotolerans]MBR7830651.1 nucleotidyl transferase AbiEii/AbiGii toxin family protein [Actinospica acidithermotolerans]